MAEIDASIPLSAKPPPNPIETVTNLAAMQNNLLAAKSAQQQYRARQAIGPIYQGAIDPATGRLDSTRLLSGAAGNPDTAWMAGDLAAAAQAREKEQLGIDAAALKLAHDRYSLAGDALVSLLARPDGSLTTRDVYDAAASLTAMAPFRDKAAMDGIVQALAGLPQDADDKAVRNFVRDLVIRSGATAERIQMVMGQMGQMDTGAAIQSVRTNPLTGQVEVVAVTPKTLSPGEQAAPRQAFINGQPGTVSTSAVVDEFGRPRAAVPGGGPGGFLPTGPRLGQAEAAGITGTKAAEQAIALQQTADQVPARRAALMSMRDLVGTFSSGPAADSITRLGSLAAQFNLPSPVSKDATKSAEEFGKLSTQIVMQQVAQLGGSGTDDKLAAALKGNPSTYLSGMGNKAVIGLMLGNEDAITAKNEAWQRWQEAGNGPETYNQFTSQFNRLYDPRVFQSVYMEPADRQKMLSGMSKAEREKFDASMKFAIQAGWIK